MATYVVELWDTSGHHFPIHVKLPFSGTSFGKWRSMAEGFIRYRKGKCNRCHWRDKEDWSLAVYNSDDVVGIVLYTFDDFWGVNDEGAGFVKQSWVIGLDPGDISWEVVE